MEGDVLKCDGKFTLSEEVVKLYREKIIDRFKLKNVSQESGEKRCAVSNLLAGNSLKDSYRVSAVARSIRKLSGHLGNDTDHLLQKLCQR